MVEMKIDDNKQQKLALSGLFEGAGAFLLIVFIALGIVIVGFRGGGYYIRRDGGLLKQTRDSATEFFAEMSLTPHELEVAVSDSFEVGVALDSKGKNISAAMAIVKYDPRNLKVKSVRNGSGFDRYFRDIGEPGNLYLEAIANPGNSFNGKGEIAIIEFSALRSSNTEVVFDFTQGRGSKTSGAVSAESGLNILKSVQKGTYIINSDNKED